MLQGEERRNDSAAFMEESVAKTQDHIRHIGSIMGEKMVAEVDTKAFVLWELDAPGTANMRVVIETKVVERHHTEYKYCRLECTSHLLKAIFHISRAALLLDKGSRTRKAFLA